LLERFPLLICSFILSNFTFSVPHFGFKIIDSLLIFSFFISVFILLKNSSKIFWEVILTDFATAEAVIVAPVIP